MRDTSVTEVGQYSSLLKVGDLQILSFADGDEGPFWMNDTERLETKDDVVTSEVITKQKTKTELLIELRQKGVDTTVKRFLKTELITLASEHHIPISKTDNDVVKGWMHKPKGMLQILWERGFIDSTKVKTARSSRYSKDGKKGDLNDEGELTEEGKLYSMNALLMNCTDFRSEVTDLEHLARELSSPDHHISILFTPEFHCEFAGEGIEYSWGASKRYYRSQPLSKKKSYRSFDKLVRWSVGKVSIQMCRKFSGKARGYMLAYHHKALEKVNAKCKSESDAIDLKFSSFDYNEKIHKIYRSHRDANSIDCAFIERVIYECITIESK